MGSTVQEQWGQGGDCWCVPCSSFCTPGAGLNSLSPAVSHRAGMETQTWVIGSGFQSMVLFWQLGNLCREQALCSKGTKPFSRTLA